MPLSNKPGPLSISPTPNGAFFERGSLPSEVPINSYTTTRTAPRLNITPLVKCDLASPVVNISDLNDTPNRVSRGITKNTGGIWQSKYEEGKKKKY